MTLFYDPARLLGGPGSGEFGGSVRVRGQLVMKVRVHVSDQSLVYIETRFSKLLSYFNVTNMGGHKVPVVPCYDTHN
jgi:hypothetical protein